jgi:diguanylate cyclase (GGDEF)-like protein
MRRRTAAKGSALRLFSLYAVVSLVPILLLGTVLAISYQKEAAARGLAEGKAEAGLLARTAVEPVLGGGDLRAGLDSREVVALNRVVKTAVAAGQIVRLRIRDLDGRVIYASDGHGLNARADDEALDAAKGEVVADVTRLNADPDEGAVDKSAPPGVRVAEVYRPLTSAVTARRIGVLEIYLPYTPIAHDVDAGLATLYRELGIGLVLLYLALAAISWSVTGRLRAEADRNAFLAEHDHLTGLPNRAQFQRRLAEALSTGGRAGPVAVAVIDLDRFKEVNDTLGHANGDALLSELASRLTSVVTGRDLVARLGGDEFGLVLIGGNAEEVSDRLTGLRGVLEEVAEVGGLPVSAEASIGFALSPEDGTDPDSLLQHADVAMHVAKVGSPSVARYDAALDHYDANKLALVAELRRAIAGDELVLHFQPKATVATGEFHAVEALVRWNHPDRGLLYPDEFLPIVEQTGIIDALTLWVVSAALKQLASRDRELSNLSVAVNISARNLSRPDFATQVLTALSQHGVAPDRLTLEMTETAFVADPQRASQLLRELSRAGVRVSLDDFGRGQTSLGYLSTLPLDEVKIDKSFVLDMLEKPSHAAIVKSVIDLAHNLGFEVVAEGVETEGVLAALTALGCDIAQGYHLARPMPGGALSGWLLAHRLPFEPVVWR